MKFKNLILHGNDIFSVLEELENSDGFYSKRIMDDRIYVFAIEKYYLRTNSTLMVFIVVNATLKNKCEINIVSGGGRTSFDGDWGAEKNALNFVLKIIKDLCRKKYYSSRGGWII